ncbi:oxygen-insensitive NADPH nitroreductase [Babesia caballi]|uniref:Oxygen-insensitive NADPH nitroreductase n=1 Tax=Babesia caballi TaxID=5871 RepID=A0AAV4LPW1_BABCB|nr:oxygen-insensitive NADPH nitroreductase [Babesia caballi]
MVTQRPQRHVHACMQPRDELQTVVEVEAKRQMLAVGQQLHFFEWAADILILCVFFEITVRIEPHETNIQLVQSGEAGKLQGDVVGTRYQRGRGEDDPLLLSPWKCALLWRKGLAQIIRHTYSG